MDNESGRPLSSDELPGVHKTVNQIVAWNIAYYRKAAGMTQEELGELIGGRSKRNVSADETSWAGGHTREFNASEIVALALALRVPIGALFLPPEGDGVTCRYLFHPNDRDPGSLGMDSLMQVVMPDSDEEGRAADVYRRRIIAAVSQYLDPDWSDDLSMWMQDMTGPEIRAARLDRWRSHRRALTLLAADADEIIERIEKAGDGE